MKSNWVKLLLKILILTSFLTTTYYLLVTTSNKHQIEIQDNQNILITNITNLSQNRIAYVELTRLDSKSPSFDAEKSDLVAIINKTNKEALENPSFPADAKEIYQRQSALLERVFATNSYERGVAILKSQEGLELLTDQTNLLLDWQKELQELER